MNFLLATSIQLILSFILVIIQFDWRQNYSCRSLVDQLVFNIAMAQRSIASYFNNRKRAGPTIVGQTKIYLIDSDSEQSDSSFVVNRAEQKKKESIYCKSGRICKFAKKAYLSPLKTCSSTNTLCLTNYADQGFRTEKNVAFKEESLPSLPISMLNSKTLDLCFTKNLKTSKDHNLVTNINEKLLQQQPSGILPGSRSLMCSPRYPSAIFPSESDEKISSVVCRSRACQKFTNLIQTENNLQLPNNYRCLFEIFKCVDLVCAMFFNRKEVITFKKLKAIVQKVLRKNFNESHLSQIKHLFPEAYQFSQAKMRNFGSTSKNDYYQLVISPNYGNITGTKETPEKRMNSLSQLLIDRQQTFHIRLLKKVKDIHANFLVTLYPELNITDISIIRWHPQFALDNCPEIEMVDLPQPPHSEKYSSARDILSTARNLFKQGAFENFPTHDTVVKDSNNFEEHSVQAGNVYKQILNYKSDILKNVPESLVEKIKAKKAAATMKSDDSQVNEKIKFTRVPILLSQLRNIFITEKKNILPLETVNKKIVYCYQMNMTIHDVELHLKYIVQKSEGWLSLHEIRRKTYLKMDRNIELKEIMKQFLK